MTGGSDVAPGVTSLTETNRDPGLQRVFEEKAECIKPAATWKKNPAHFMPQELGISLQSGRRTRPNQINTQHAECMYVCVWLICHCIPTCTWLLPAPPPLGDYTLLSAQPVNKSGFIKYTLVTLH